MQVLAQGIQVSDLLLNKYGLAVFAAILSGLAAYLTGSRLEAKKFHKTLKQLSWDMDVNSRLVSIKDELKQKVQVKYAGESVTSLTTVTFQVTNTGGAVVKDQFLRFAFPEKAQMLEVDLAPRPEPELDVSEVFDDVPPGNRRYRIGHLEPGQRVQFKFVSDGGDWSGWRGVHPKNDEGGVVFERRDVSRVKADKEHIRPFAVQAVLLVLTQLVLSNVAFYQDVLDFVRVAITLVLGGLLLSHLVPIVRLVERSAYGWNSGSGSGSTESHNMIHGNTDGYVIQARSIEGDVHLHNYGKQDPDAEETQPATP
ncbi:hypothetical protein [Lentzea albida]|uniref:Uncharacterized protein n=1 Tax=Lentzea albida TaxID=65499 RepID=A0A1H9KDV3_9PSEU|nr:hypothetical protein [Lentzea albida]SEQ97095.1 hypothetical protein SAMN04488000_105283 [Lentzea albida]